jgi:acetyl esterase/lipase
VGTEAVDRPEVMLYPAKEPATGAMVVICPGGGYGVLAIDHEGQQIARWFNSLGISAAVVKYRLGPRYHHPAPLQDVQRAIRYVRSRAVELKIDPARVGVMGFSAGGHLASTVSTHFDLGDSMQADPVEHQSCRPDFSILCYPVISLKSEFGHKGSARNLLGENPDVKLLESLSTETRVTGETPPTFLFHTGEDKGVPVQNALVYYQALVENGVPAELHVYQQGPHGVGLANGNPVLTTWKERLADWLKVNGFLTKAAKQAASGKISVGDKPLRWGTIGFYPVGQPLAPVAWAMVSQGNYRFSPAGSPVEGMHRVVIWNWGSVEPNPTIFDASSLTGPEDKSPLTVQVGTGSNEFNFNLPAK